MSNPTRQYYPVWQVLKTDLIVRIAVPRPLHKRVIKAVTKEKWMDTVYKYDLLESKDSRAELVTKVSNNIITFSLIIRKVNRIGNRVPISLADLI